MKYLLHILFILSVSYSFSQNTVSTCYFGTTGIDFRTHPPTILNNSGMDASESAASICDASGDILFYTNGGAGIVSLDVGAIWNKNHQIMDNGLLEDSAGCVSSYYGAIIVPVPDDGLKQKNDLYYVITRDCIESSFSAPIYNAGLTYSLVDMSQNAGLGKVIEKYQSILPYSNVTGHSSSHEPLAAILQANQIDYWLFSYRNDSLYRLAITDTGFHSFQVLEPGIGKITISPARDFLVAGPRLYELDVATGDLTFKANFGYIRDVAFSADGSYLYTISDSGLFQYQLGANNWLASKTLISTFGPSYKLFLAPNGRIYLFLKEAVELAGEITCPSRQGTACGLNMTPLSLNGGSTGTEFTHVMAHYLYQSGSNCMVGVEEFGASHIPIDVYPNPSTGLIQISPSTEMEYYVEVYSLSGHLLKTSAMFQTKGQIDLSAYANGVYLLKLISHPFVFHRKVILH